MSTSYELDEVDAFVVDAIGVPGARTFYFRARIGDAVLSFKCEKVQAQALAEAIRALMGDLPPTTASPVSVPSIEADVDAEWVVGSIGLGYEAAGDRVVVILEEIGDDFEDLADVDVDPDDDLEDDLDELDPEYADHEPDAGTARVALTRGQALAFVERTEVLVRAGRPPCPLCASPIDVTGYRCVCFN